jgi:hypothetical protein
MGNSILSSIPNRCVAQRPAANHAPIHWRNRQGDVLVFHPNADICIHQGRWAWLQSNQCLLYLDRRKDGLFFLKGHGRD